MLKLLVGIPHCTFFLEHVFFSSLIIHNVTKRLLSGLMTLTLGCTMYCIVLAMESAMLAVVLTTIVPCQSQD